LPTDFASTLRGYLINVYAVAPYRLNLNLPALL
jgi:hypothetical protein